MAADPRRNSATDELPSGVSTAQLHDDREALDVGGVGISFMRYDFDVLSFNAILALIRPRRTLRVPGSYF